MLKDQLNFNLKMQIDLDKIKITIFNYQKKHHTSLNLSRTVLLAVLFSSFAFLANAQRLFVPMTRGGQIGVSQNQGIGIDTDTPDGMFQINSPQSNFKIGFGGANAHHVSSSLA